MKKLILMALAFAGLNASASGTIGIKPVVNDPKCNGGNTGSVTLMVSGGVTPYTYHWSNSLPGTSSQAGLTAGTYNVTVTDHVGTTSTYTLIIGEPTALNLVTNAQNVSAHGANDGCVHLQVAGGTPEYDYHWSNNANIESPCGLTAGTYYVTVTDAFGCSAIASKTVAQPAQVVRTGNNNYNQSHGTAPGTGDNGTTRSEIATDARVTTEATASVNIYPNPSSDYVNVNIEGATSSEISIYNTLGQLVVRKITEATETRIDVSGFAKGNYIASIKNENGTINKMVTIVK